MLVENLLLTLTHGFNPTSCETSLKSGNKFLG